MVTQMYAFNSWSRQKTVGYGSDSLPYVGFPGLSLTPIPESPLLDAPLTQKDLDRFEHEHHYDDESSKGAETRALVVEEHSHFDKIKKVHSLPAGFTQKQCRAETTVILENREAEVVKMNGHTPSRSCSVNVQVVQTTFLPKDDEMNPLQKRSHLCKLLLFALVGFAIVAGIVIWVFSPTFT